MKLTDVVSIYQMISNNAHNRIIRDRSILLRKAAFNGFISNTGFSKIAFDTRRINQETDYIPRRGLQNYHRSEKFLSDHITYKIVAFKKLAVVLDQLKSEYGKNPEWHDSYTRILTAAVHRGLRTVEADGDFSDVQPSMASLDYLEELMYVRYRMTTDELKAMSEDQLRKSILSKDELLVKSGFQDDEVIIKPSDISKTSYDDMVNKMLTTMAQVMSSYKPVQSAPDDNLTNKLFDVKATKDIPEIERTVTITIKDKVVDKDLAKVSEVQPSNIIISADEEE